MIKFLKILASIAVVLFMFLEDGFWNWDVTLWAWRRTVQEIIDGNI